jgi:ATP-binding cassette subfamily B (MDR/TAP) protein 8
LNKDAKIRFFQNYPKTQVKNENNTSSRPQESFEQFYGRHFAILRQFFNNRQKNSQQDNKNENNTNARFNFNSRNWDPLSLFDAEIWTSIIIVAIGSLLLLGQTAHAEEAPETAKPESIIETTMKETKKSFWRKLWDMIYKELPYLIGAMLMVVASSFTGLIMPKYVKTLIDMVGVAEKSQLIRPVMQYLGLVLLQGLLSFAFSSLLSIGADKIAARLKQRLLDSILQQELAFFDKQNTGELLSRVNEDIGEVRHAIKNTIGLGIRSATGVFGGIISLLLISKRLTLMVGLLIPAMVLIGTVYGRYLRKLSRNSQDLWAKASSKSEEVISNVRTVRAFANEKYESERIASASNSAMNKTIKFSVALALFQSLSGLAINGLMLLVLGMGTLGGHYFGGGDHLSGGSLTQFMVTTLNVERSFAMLSILFGQVVRGVAAGQRIFEIIDRRPEVDIHRGQELPGVNGKIEFYGVDFRYPTRKDIKVLDNISFTLESGKVYSLVGSSGSGKSTIASMIERFYDPEAGAILLDGVDTKSLKPSWLRRQIGLVGQEPVLFQGTIGENVRYGNTTATQEQVVEACKVAHCHEFITKFPDQYETTVGERGVQLSGGQKQRIAIARALLKNPKILILDEATSALDAESEMLVQEAMQALMKNRTVLIIAHRLSTIKHSDCIFVVQSGKIVEKGTHKDLMAENGIYSKLIKQQFATEMK